MKWTFLLVGLMLLMGCSRRVVWDKPGLTQESFSRDNLRLRKESGTTIASANPNTGATRVRTRTDATLYKLCMESRGYTRSR
jgi:uncharacterized protein YcfL